MCTAAALCPAPSDALKAVLAVVADSNASADAVAAQACAACTTYAPSGCSGPASPAAGPQQLAQRSCVQRTVPSKPHLPQAPSPTCTYSAPHPPASAPPSLPPAAQ